MDPTLLELIMATLTADLDSGIMTEEEKMAYRDPRPGAKAFSQMEALPDNRMTPGVRVVGLQRKRKRRRNRNTLTPGTIDKIGGGANPMFGFFTNLDLGR